MYIGEEWESAGRKNGKRAKGRENGAKGRDRRGRWNGFGCSNPFC